MPPASPGAAPLPRLLTYVLLGCVLGSVVGTAPGRSQEAEARVPTADGTLELVEVLVEPAAAPEVAAADGESRDGLPPETLCTLTVRLRNLGDRPISALVFEVEIDGTSLPVYEKQVFMALVPASSVGSGSSDGEAGDTGSDDASFDLRLFNFWTTDSRRSAPSDGTLDMRVRLTEAQWVDVSTEESRTEVWSLEGPVPGLPLQATISLPLVDD